MYTKVILFQKGENLKINAQLVTSNRPLCTFYEKADPKSISVDNKSAKNIKKVGGRSSSRLVSEILPQMVG